MPSSPIWTAWSTRVPSPSKRTRSAQPCRRRTQCTGHLRHQQRIALRRIRSRAPARTGRAHPSRTSRQLRTGRRRTARTARTRRLQSTHHRHRSTRRLRSCGRPRNRTQGRRRPRSPHPGLQPEDGLGRPRRSRLHPRKPRCAVDRNQHRPDHPQGARSGARQRNSRCCRSNRLTPYPARCGQAPKRPSSTLQQRP